MHQSVVTYVEFASTGSMLSKPSSSPLPLYVLSACYVDFRSTVPHWQALLCLLPALSLARSLSLSLSALQSHPHSETAAGENLDLDLYWTGLGLPGTSTTKGNSQRTVWCHPITHKLQAPKKAHSDYRNGDRQQPHLTLSFPSVRVSCASKCKEQNPKGSFWDA